jgi:hypothetical protein
VAVNIIDALVMTLGLDNSQFRKGRGETEDDLKKLRESGSKTSSELSAGGTKMAEGFRAVRNEVAGMLVVLAGASSIKALFADIVAGDAATGRLAQNLGVSTHELSAWQAAAQGAGGSANDANAAFQTMVSTLENVRLRGDLSQGAELAGLGVTDLTDPTKALMQIADARKRMTAPEFQNRLQHLGLSQGMINLLTQGTSAVREQVAAAREHAAITDQDALAAERLQKAQADMANQLRKLVRPELYSVVTVLTDMLTAANNVADTNDKLGASFRALGKDLGVTNALAHIWNLEKQAMAALLAGDFAKANRLDDEAAQVNLLPNSHDAENGLTDVGGNGFETRPTPQNRLPAKVAGIEAYLRNAGFSAEQSRGIRAGIQAEGGGLGMAANGAFGIGQWRGDRQRALFARYGNAPSMEQQLAFLVSELRGGDRGGAAVTHETTASGALLAYITAFMRPGPGVSGDMRRGMAALGMSGSGRAYAASIARATRAGARFGNQSAPSTTTTTVGQIVVHTAATDGPGVARDLQAELRKRGLVYQAQSGMVP